MKLKDEFHLLSRVFGTLRLFHLRLFTLGYHRGTILAALFNSTVIELCNKLFLFILNF